MLQSLRTLLRLDLGFGCANLTQVSKIMVSGGLCFSSSSQFLVPAWLVHSRLVTESRFSMSSLYEIYNYRLCDLLSQASVRKRSLCYPQIIRVATLEIFVLMFVLLPVSFAFWLGQSPWDHPSAQPTKVLQTENEISKIRKWCKLSSFLEKKGAKDGYETTIWCNYLTTYTFSLPLSGIESLNAEITRPPLLSLLPISSSNHQLPQTP